jgi:phage terminase large subunit-like protein
MDEIPVDQWRRWTPAAQEQALAAVREIETRPWKPFYCPKVLCDGKPHGQWNFPHARWDQHPPKGDWLTWLLRGGRGSGKTRTGSEWTHRRTKVSPRIALLAPNVARARDTLVEGESGILATAPPGQMPQWEPSKHKLTFANGAQAFTYSMEEPDSLRGPQHFDAWVDEPAHAPLIEQVWNMLLFGMRLGRRPRICATTTPVPTAWMKNLIADPSTVSVAVSTYANIDNLAPVFADQILRKYEGTRLGRQEIHGEILADVDGALWQYEYFDGEELRFETPPALDRIVVAVDPAGTNRKKSDETGIVVIGATGEDYYVLADWSGKYSPKGWAERTMTAYREFSADAVVVETNYGGDMVRNTLENVDQWPRIEEVVSRRGKVIRADPIVALYERGLVHHSKTGLGDLEDQLVSWVPGNDSPDRLDALVHGLTNLARTFEPSSVSSPVDLRGYMAQQTIASRFPHLQIARPPA